MRNKQHSCLKKKKKKGKGGSTGRTEEHERRHGGLIYSTQSDFSPDLLSPWRSVLRAACIAVEGVA
jgi:hypothetical protein